MVLPSSEGPPVGTDAEDLHSPHASLPYRARLRVYSMAGTRKEHPLGPLLLAGLAVLLILVATVAPGSGAIPAQTSCPYASCVTPTPNYSLYYILAGIFAVIAAIAIAVLLIMRRRRPPSASTDEAGYAGDAGGGFPGDGPIAPGTSDPGAPYIESPEDAAAPAPEPVPPAPAPAAGAAEGEADIDSLMQELDRISGEILKRGAPKKGSPPPPTDEDRAE